MVRRTIMADSESVLLHRFVHGGDGGAFSDIVRRHAGLVYGTCLRVLADADQAADATQETFFQLVRKADDVTGSIPGWLHRVAVAKAVDLIRSDARRRSRERAYADGKAVPDTTWREVCPYVDETLNRLDDQTRAVLIGHFLEGRSMTALAQELGVSRPTVSRRVESGLTKLRAGLHKRGVAITAVGLSGLLVEHAAQSAPLSLLRDIGKVSLVGANAIAGAGSGAAASGATVVASGMLAAAKTKLVVATAALVIGVGLVTYTRFSSEPPGAPVPPPVVGQSDRRAPSTGPSRSAPVRLPEGPAEPVESETAPQTVGDGPSFWPQVAEAEEAVELPAAAAGAERTGSADFELDLSSPEGTARSFAKAIIFGDTEKALACWFETAIDYEDIRQGMESQPGDRDYEAKMWFQSLDPDAEIPIVWSEDIEGGMELEFRVTLKEDATMRGRSYQAGDTEDIRITVRPSGDSWLIDNM
jgi:RNA polymerase sigma factor (sigma-70 family)